MFQDNGSGWEDTLTLRKPYWKQAPKKGNGGKKYRVQEGNLMVSKLVLI